MVLTRTEKEQLVSNLAEQIRSAASAAVFSYRTLTVSDSAKLRRELRAGEGKMQVVKKRLFRRVAVALGLPPDVAAVEGSVAVAWSGNEIIPAKVAHGFVSGREGAQLSGGLLHGLALTRAEVEALALLPGERELRGQFVSVVAGPIRGLAGVLSGTLRGLPGILHALADKS